MKTLKTALAIGVAATTLALSAPRPALADGAASTRNLILGAAALVAGVAIESNVARKNRAATTVQGYLPDGSTVYANGEVVDPNGGSYYPSDRQETVACSDRQCRLENANGYDGGYGYGGNGYGGNGNGGYGNGAYANAGYRDGRSHTGRSARR